ncbi:MAG: hypothetical protein JSR59_05275 [Proteobacteria bacterium]|nr:hypothetical protein [Pseudomonadota bacterium]
MTARRIVLHIDRLALRGFDRADRHAIVEALRDALGRQLAEAGAVADLMSAPPLRERLHVDGVRLGNGASGNGARLAGAIAQGVVGPRRARP